MATLTTTTGCVRVASFSALGVEAAGACDDAGVLLHVALRQPFLGSTESGVGVGADRTTIEAALGPADDGVDARGLTVYRGAAALPIGVLFREARHCTERAAAIVLNDADDANVFTLPD